MRRFTIGRLMLVVGGAAMLLAPFRLVAWDSIHPLLIAQGVALVGGLVGGSAAFGLGRPRPRFALASFLGGGALWGGATALILIYLLSFGGILLLELVTLLLGPIVLGAGAAWVAERARAEGKHPRRPRRLAALLAALAVPVSMMMTQWPLSLAFALSRPALERLADRIAAGESLTGPEWAGCYRVVAAEVSPFTGNLALIIDASPGGRAGFTRVRDHDRSYHPLVNLDFDMRLGGPWHYQEED